jgi:ubiquinol-cytochrome c reductase cytochrome b subunit
MSQSLFWRIVSTVMLLTWIGARPVEDPYILVGQVLTVAYFSIFLAIGLIKTQWEKMLV